MFVSPMLKITPDRKVVANCGNDLHVLTTFWAAAHIDLKTAHEQLGPR